MPIYPCHHKGANEPPHPQITCVAWWLSCLLCVATLSSFPQSSHANITRAVEAYKQGYNLYFQKKHSLALQYFLLSYQSLPQQKRYNKTRNALNFLIGDCHFVLKQYQKAYVRLRAFVVASRKRNPNPTSKQYKTAQSHLRIIRNKLNLRPVNPPRVVPQPNVRQPATPVRVPPRATVRQPGPPSQPPVPKARRPHTAGWVIAGLGVASLAGGVIVGILANSQMEQAYSIYNAQRNTPQPPAADVTSLAQTALTQGLAANVMYISGGVLTGAGLIMLLTWSVPSEKSGASTPNQ